MATGRSNGRPRTPNGKRDLATQDITEELLDKIATPPNDLNEDGQYLWYKVWSGGDGWLIDADTIVVYDLCQIYQDKELYRRALATGSVPRVYKMPNGILTPHPYTKLLKEARSEMTTHLSSLGFNPSDRAKLGAIESMSDEDPLIGLIKRKQEREAKRRAMVASDG